MIKQPTEYKRAVILKLLWGSLSLQLLFDCPLLTMLWPVVNVGLVQDLVCGQACCTAYWLNCKRVKPDDNSTTCSPAALPVNTQGCASQHALASEHSLSPGWIREQQAANLHVYGCLAQLQVGLALLYTLEGGLDVDSSLLAFC